MHSLHACGCCAPHVAGVVDGVRHYRGQFKRTWEVLRDEGGHSYRIEDNDNYKLALGTQVLGVCTNSFAVKA